MTARRYPVDDFIDQAQEALEALRFALHESMVASGAQLDSARRASEEVEHHLIAEHQAPPAASPEGEGENG